MDAIVKCSHCHTQNQVRVQWPAAVEHCINPKCRTRLHLFFPDPCFYCARKVADFSGDPLVGFPRCIACRKMHKLLTNTSIFLKGLFVSILLIGIAFFSFTEEAWLLWSVFVVCSLLFAGLLYGKYLREIPCLSRKESVWGRSFLTFNGYLNSLGGMFFLSVIVWPKEFLSAFSPKLLLPAENNTSAMKAFFALDGLQGLEYGNLLAGLLGLAGIIWVCDLLFVNGIPILQGTRPLLFPRVNLKPKELLKNNPSQPGTLRKGLTPPEVEHLLGVPLFKPETSMKDEQVWVYRKRTTSPGWRRLEFPVFFNGGRVVRWGPQHLENFSDVLRKVGVIIFILVLAITGMVLANQLKL